MLANTGTDYFRQAPGPVALTTLDARYSFRLKSGYSVYVQSQGFRYGQDAEAVELLKAGRAQQVDPPVEFTSSCA